MPQQLDELLGTFLAYLLDLPFRIIGALFEHPLRLLELIVLVGMTVGAIYFIARWRRKSLPIFHDLVRRLPTVAKSDTLAIAEQEAFEKVKGFLVDSMRVETVSQSRVAQLKQIRSDLSFIQSEMNGNRFRNLPDLRRIWEFTLHKAAVQISEDYQLDHLAELVAKLRTQMEMLSSPEGTNVDRDNH